MPQQRKVSMVIAFEHASLEFVCLLRWMVNLDVCSTFHTMCGRDQADILQKKGRALSELAVEMLDDPHRSVTNVGRRGVHLDYAARETPVEPERDASKHGIRLPSDVRKPRDLAFEMRCDTGAAAILFMINLLGSIFAQRLYRIERRSDVSHKAPINVENLINLQTRNHST